MAGGAVSGRHRLRHFPDLSVFADASDHRLVEQLLGGKEVARSIGRQRDEHFPRLIGQLDLDPIETTGVAIAGGACIDGTSRCPRQVARLGAHLMTSEAVAAR